jgi:hypothetical protein
MQQLVAAGRSVQQQGETHNLFDHAIGLSLATISWRKRQDGMGNVHISGKI